VKFRFVQENRTFLLWRKPDICTLGRQAPRRGLLGAGIAVSAVALCAVAAAFALPRRSRKRLLDVLGGPEVLARHTDPGEADPEPASPNVS
jgi:hypothetical protein